MILDILYKKCSENAALFLLCLYNLKSDILECEFVP